ncbi:membrane fusion protein, multidrug efflux system [Salegentibacter echinorum]|uniref:Membrane fusion protein, multidrug efflux system n=1 Tax=Salegentibacter echinorum TaxID=1073325 RepID=A0A1M5IJ53_SALEC|nr:efflux RND transporter periplasmic adaptor subunit [Salegentibacter echinorum]SHG28295.1 membrane fusion protein, multidrug efflux system [Salegentibacter echinorum]
MRNIIKHIAVLTATLTLISCGDDQNAQQAGQQRTMPFPVFEVPTQTVTGYSSYPTSIEGVISSEVRAKVSGYITDVLVDEGEKVKKGQILFKLETESLNQEADAAKANVNAAQVEVDKLKPLVEKDIISEVQLETAKAKLQQAKSNYNSISANIGYANIKSPVNGYVGSIRFRRGVLISPSDPQPLTTVADISEVYAYFSLNEDEYLDFINTAEGKTREEKIKNMPPVKLVMANGKTYAEEGKIEAINSQVNKSTGSVSFRAIFPNPNRILTNGNSGEIKIPQTFEDAVVVPQRSTYEQQGQTYVYKVVETDSNTVANSTQIKITTPVKNLYVIESGIEKGDKVIAKGIGKLKNGTPIKPQEVPFDSIAKPMEQVFR